MKDEEIIALLADPAEHEKAFRGILKAYKEKIYYHVRKIVIDHDDADDVTQEAFIKIWRNLDKFRGDSKLYTWLYRIATNEALTFLQKKKKDRGISIDDNEMLVATLESSKSDTYMGGEEIEMKLQKALLLLTDKQRVVFNLKYFEELKYEEIAEITETSVGGLKATYHFAVKKIEEFLTKN
ncbi:RNA polymerase sigma factor [Lacihabitans sp. LS3-19]|uniref:RNA polymerase sigma factor n=1 Tax=Lacihabitans sp. LS3-19 TaxID=2487335 RepID=UPI0020CF484F|nr:RNA polymerase sigma factor [Lacihabitans sp. LS3-19]MCP9770255.1 RNA polymerase sigma factor [Lacihabitans sp. LS3-19]